eukprot:3991686-Amphidinium_carterae.2
MRGTETTVDEGRVANRREFHRAGRRQVVTLWCEGPDLIPGLDPKAVAEGKNNELDVCSFWDIYDPVEREQGMEMEDCKRLHSRCYKNIFPSTTNGIVLRTTTSIEWLDRCIRNGGSQSTLHGTTGRQSRAPQKVVTPEVHVDDIYGCGSMEVLSHVKKVLGEKIKLKHWQISYMPQGQHMNICTEHE